MKKKNKVSLLVFVLLLLSMLPFSSASAARRKCDKPIATTRIRIGGNVDASAPTLPIVAIPATSGTPPTTAYDDLFAYSSFSTTLGVYDSLGARHLVTFIFFHTGIDEYSVRAYVNNEEVDSSTKVAGFPRLLTDNRSWSDITMIFGGNGERLNSTEPGKFEKTFYVLWNNGSNTSRLHASLSRFTQYSTTSVISHVNRNGRAAKCR